MEQTGNNRSSGKRHGFQLHSSEVEERTLVRIAIYIVLVTFLNFAMGSCSYYKVTSVDRFPFEPVPEKVYKEMHGNAAVNYEHPTATNSDYTKWLADKRMPVIRYDNQKWMIQSPQVNDLSMSGHIYPAFNYQNPKDDPTMRKNKRVKKGGVFSEEDYVTRLVIFDVDKLKVDSGNFATIPYRDINKVDIYWPDHGKTAGSTMGIFFIVVGGIAIAALIILAATWDPSSCPLIYTWDGNSWQFSGEIYGGAIYPSLERSDYLKLPAYSSQQGQECRVRISNELEEDQYINQAELTVVKHDRSITPYFDKYGDLQTILSPIIPSSAVNTAGNDCLSEVSSKDMVSHHFDGQPDTSLNPACTNSLEFTFVSDKAPQQGKLLVHAKNSFWGDKVVGDLWELFGNRYHRWVKSQENVEASEHIQWMLDQGLPLAVYARTMEGWKFLDYYPLTGALASRDMVLPVDLSDAWTPVNEGDGYSVTLKLVSGFNFWELDQVSLDLSANAPAEVTYLDASKAVDGKGVNLSPLLNDDDDRYLVQDRTGDEAFLDFIIPDAGSQSHSLFLHTKGYYLLDRHTRGKPDVQALEAFSEPGKLSRWSYEKFVEIGYPFTSLTKNGR